MRITALVLLSLLALWGLALGAQTQKEVFLEPDAQQRDAANQGAAGNLIVLTAFPVALGVAGAAALLSRRPVRRRLGPAALLAGAVYGGVLLAQSAWPNYLAIVENRYATLTNSLLAANLPAVPSLLVAPLALLLGTLLLAGWAGRRLLGRDIPSAPRPPLALLQSQAAATLLAAPFLALAAFGNLRLLLVLPADQPGLGPYFVVLPGAALTCLCLMGLAIAKTWHLGTYVRNGRLAAAVHETWQALGRAETAALLLLACLALAASFLPATELAELALGRTFEVTLRGHTQLLLLLGIPLAPALAVHGRVTRHFTRDRPQVPTLEHGTHVIALATLTASLATVGLAIVATWSLERALWGWFLACLAPVAVAAWWCDGRRSAPHLLLAAFLLWAMGNTIEARYDGGREALLAFAQPPGLLALWRSLGAVLAAAALARLAARLAARNPATLALAAGAGFSLAAVALLELPLTAWLMVRPASVDAIAVGSIVASLDPPVRIALHAVATLLAVAAAVLVARLHRPDWFDRRPPPPLAVIRPKRSSPRPTASDLPPSANGPTAPA